MCAQAMHADQMHVYAFLAEYWERASLAATQAAIIPPKSLLSCTANRSTQCILPRVCLCQIYLCQICL